MVNNVNLLGNTGNTIDIHYFENGDSVGKLSLATNESYNNKQTGEKVTETQWHNIVFRNKACEVIQKYVEKGDRLYVSGKIKYRKYQDTEGNDKYVTEIIVRDFTLLGTKHIEVNDPQ